MPHCSHLSIMSYAEFNGNFNSFLSYGSQKRLAYFFADTAYAITPYMNEHEEDVKMETKNNG